MRASKVGTVHRDACSAHHGVSVGNERDENKWVSMRAVESLRIGRDAVEGDRSWQHVGSSLRAEAQARGPGATAEWPDTGMYEGPSHWRCEAQAVSCRLHSSQVAVLLGFQVKDQSTDSRSRNKITQ